MKYSRIVYSLLVICLLLGTSCLSNKQTVIIQDGIVSEQEPTLFMNPVPQYKIQGNDVLSIKIKTLDKDNSSYMNIQPDGMMNINAVATYLNGYSVNKDGVIHIPSVGPVKIGGLTIDEARGKVQEEVHKQLPRASVLVTLVSFKVSVIGEVRKPGYFYVYNNQLNLIEALALAGDLDDYADRTSINLIRQTPKGSEAIVIDLTKPNLLQNPYYWLQPSDVIYVPPLEVKNNRHNLANMTILNVLLTGVTTTVAVISLINNTRRLNAEE
ncbi:MAG: polysaccharide biosynthesis/export family protein [Bacteroidota bacterium]